MLDLIKHRGPDGRGTYVDEHLAMGNVLLAIVDIGNGAQPMRRVIGAEEWVAVFNGEIYNHKELRRDLERDGVSFSTQCDTEVALASFAVWGAPAATRLDGQWALAIWNVKRRRLVLSRDPFGIKPLFYHHGSDGFAFASEPKALLCLPDVSRSPDLDAVREYFLHGFAFAAGYSLSHRSFYESIKSLPPGHNLTWEPGIDPHIKRYFSFPSAPPITNLDLREAPRLLRTALRASTEACMMGDASIGVALSGGLDSSAITAEASRITFERGDPPLLASCIRYSSQLQNADATHATLLAETLRHTTPISLVFSSMDVDKYLEDLDELIDHFDEPHWEVKQLAMFNNYRQLRSNGAKVVLTGEGADELFFGYYHRFPGFKNPSILSGGDLRQVWSRRFQQVQALLSSTTSEKLTELQDVAIERFYAPAAALGADPDRCMQAWYVSTFLHWLLLDNDRCSMAFSLEGRFPFLNRSVYELALSIPAAVQVGADLGGEKLVLRDACSDSLPPQIWRERKKAPLPSPTNLAFHAVIRDALRRAIDDASPSVWDVLDRRGTKHLLHEYDRCIAALTSTGAVERGGDRLTSYLRLDEPWSIRTPHAFGALTFLRWWALNFA